MTTAQPINSVLGPVEPGGLGPTDCHDHLLIRDSHTVRVEPEFRLDDVEVAVAEARWLRECGGRTVLDCMPIGVGRDVDGLVEVASRTGLTVLAVTGFHRDAFYDPEHWVRRLDVDGLTETVLAEATKGLGRSPYDPPDADRGDVLPAAIKVAVSGERPTRLEARQIAAVGTASVTTGLPVITHTESIVGAHAQLDRLARCGVPSERVVLSHMDRHGDLADVVSLCRAGATVCLDWMGRVDRGSDEVIVDLATGLVEAGCGDRVVLGQDLARRRYWRGYGGGPGLAHMFATVVPLLSERLGDDAVRTLLVDTPRRVLTPRGDA